MHRCRIMHFGKVSCGIKCRLVPFYPKIANMFAGLYSLMLMKLFWSKDRKGSDLVVWSLITFILVQEFFISYHVKKNIPVLFKINSSLADVTDKFGTVALAAVQYLRAKNIQEMLLLRYLIYWLLVIFCKCMFLWLPFFTSTLIVWLNL